MTSEDTPEAAIYEAWKAGGGFTGEDRAYADREETDSCEAGTPGCCIDHTRDHGSCESW